MKWTRDCRRGYHAMHVYDSYEERCETLRDLLEWMGDDEVLIQASDHWCADDRSLFSPFYERGQLYPLHPNGKPLDYTREIADAMERAKEGGKRGVVLALEAKDLQRFLGDYDDLMRYEVELNLRRFELETTILCQYDRSAFSEEELERAGSIHQMKLEGGRLERNYWVVYTNYWR